MKTYVNQMTLVRKSGRCPETVARKIAAGTIAPDAVLLIGGREALLFDSERLPELRKALRAETGEVVL
jgi:hypothetical protein